MSNKYLPNCVAVMDKIDLNSNALDFDDHRHMSSCASCYSYYKIDQKIMSQLRQCFVVEIPENLKNCLIEQIKYYDSAQPVNNRFDHYQINPQHNVKPKNSNLMTEWMTCAACITLVLLSLTLFIFNMTSVLSETVIEHLEHRHISAYSKPPPANMVRELLSPYNMNIDNMVSQAIYADECTIDSKKSVHIVYSINKQLVSLVVMPVTRSLNDIRQIGDRGYQGVIVSVENGTVVIASKDKTAVSDFIENLRVHSQLFKA